MSRYDHKIESCLQEIDHPIQIKEKVKETKSTDKNH